MSTHPASANTGAANPTKWLTLVLCFIVALLEGLDLQAAGIAAPGIGAEFKLLPPQVGGMFSAGLVGLLPSALFGGWLADRIGRKKVLIGSVLLFGLFSLATAYVWDYHSLLAARFLAGLGLGAALPILIALSSEAADDHNRSVAVSLTYAGIPLGGALAAVLGMVNVGSGWRGLFYVGGVLPVAIALLLVVLLPESRAFVARSTQAAQPEQPSTSEGMTHLFKASMWKSTLLLWLASFFVLTVLYMLLNWLPSLLQGKGFSRADSGMVQLLFNFGGAAGSLLVGRLMDSQGRRFTAICIYLGMLLSLAGLGLSDSFGLMLLAGLGAGFCALGGQLVLYAMAPTLYPTAIRATGVGASITLGRLGAIGGPMIAGHVLAAGMGLGGVMAAAAPGIVVAALAVMGLMRRQPALHT
jgi:AAHS family 3-hydroxyphenylpropionic acid transporter